MKKFSEIEMNQKTRTVALIEAIEELQTKNGNAYCRVTMSDGTETIKANLWDITKDKIRLEVNTLATVELMSSMYNDQVSYTLYKHGPAPETESILDYIRTAPLESQKMYDEILSFLRKEVPRTDRADLVTLVELIYEQNKEKLMYWSAAKTIHHNCHGGLLYHTYRMVKSVIPLTRVYPMLNKEILLAGTALHDIGKLVELETSPLGSADYTVSGNLLGHLFIGASMIKETADSSGMVFDAEMLELLLHCIASHHGELEYGAIAKPCIPEAFVISQIDMLDARIYQFEEEVNKLQPGTMSDRVFGLNTRVYRRTDQ